jgi:N-acetylmuramoyl-L-alanine amidase CwlA
MKIIKSILTKNPCYTAGRKITVKGLMLHSVGCAQPSAQVFVRIWNRPSYGAACVHGFIDGNDGTIYQTLPWNHRGWHCGSGRNGSGNNTHIGVEMCEPATIRYTGGGTFTCSNLADARACARRTYNAAVELFAYLCKEYGLNPMKDGVILSHAEGNARGIATNHGDPEHLWRGLALPYTMNTFRKAVKLKMEGKTGTVQEPAKADTDQKTDTQKPTAKKFYRVRKSWGDAASQLGAFKNLELAKKRADQSKGYKVFDSNGKQVYPKTETTSTTKKKSVTALAKEVIAGKWGVGEDRKKKLTAAGYDYAAVQKKVNEILK